MFSNKKRCFPQGTFIATPLRVIAILQLCLSFTCLAYFAGYPFMGELFEIKSSKVLYEAVIGKGDDAISHHFSKLPYIQRRNIEDQYHNLQQKLEKPVGDKLKQSINILISEIPPFEKAWLAFSIAISILLLLRIEGAATAAWILPLIVLLYSADNIAYGLPNENMEEKALFPSEHLIVTEYLEKPLSSNILEQKEQLLGGWNTYLIKEWAQEKPSEDDVIFQDQAKKGGFYFNLERIEALKSKQYGSDTTQFRQKVPPFLLLTYLLWNIFFAWFINRKKWENQ